MAVRIHEGVLIFQVNKRSDWTEVVNYLLRLATASPLPDAEAEFYSKNLDEVRRRMQRLIDANRKGEALEYSAGVEYKGLKMLSIILTLEPGSFHLSAVEVLGPMLFNRLPDKIAKEIAEAFFEKYEERTEGAITEVRHFYQKLK
jgi:hypothetical protein